MPLPGGLRLVYVVLDGAPDSPTSPKRALEEANKPNIDSLARSSVCGSVITVSRGVAPESDVAVMSLLGYDPSKYYTGRGPLEALGAGIDFRDGDVALRANFATVDPRTLRIIDRRAGRSLTSREARELAEALDGLPLDEGRARALFRATIGHRGVLVLRHSLSRLSADITNTDPAYERIGRISHARRDFPPYIQEARPLSNKPEAVLTAKLVNEFTRKAIEILDKHPVNEERRKRGLPPANAVLLRDAGDSLPNAPPFAERFGFTLSSIVEMVVERGIARALGIRDLEVGVDIESTPRSELLRREAELAAEAIRKYDGVYVHLKGPDEPGHDGDFEAKVKAVEDIDKFFFARLIDLIDPSQTIIVVTSDHATPWDHRAHSDDPVPLMISHPSLGESHESFNERECSRGSLGTLEGGYKIIPTILDVSTRIAKSS